MTLQEYISTSCQMALQGVNPLTSPILDIEMVAESLLPTIFQQVCLSYSGNPQAYSLPVRTHTVALTNGVCILPDEVLTTCKYGASIADPADVTVAQTQSLVPFWTDFIQPRDSMQLQLNWWTLKGGAEFHLLQADEEYDPASGFTGNIEYTSPSVVEIPALATDPLVAPSEIVSDLQAALAKALMGRMVKAAA